MATVAQRTTSIIGYKKIGSIDGWGGCGLSKGRKGGGGGGTEEKGKEEGKGGRIWLGVLKRIEKKIEEKKISLYFTFWKTKKSCCARSSSAQRYSHEGVNIVRQRSDTMNLRSDMIQLQQLITAVIKSELSICQKHSDSSLL